MTVGSAPSHIAHGVEWEQNLLKADPQLCSQLCWERHEMVTATVALLCSTERSQWQWHCSAARGGGRSNCDVALLQGDTAMVASHCIALQQAHSDGGIAAEENHSSGGIALQHRGS